MPISPIVLQRRHAELGRIRLGAKRGGSGAPMKLEQFRFTSHSERYIRDLAVLYGGEPRPWDNNGVASWEVYTDANNIPVIAVKGGLSQWMESWSGGGCTHRCDGENNVLTGDPCKLDDPNHVNAKPTTRLSVMLPELEAIGVWRMESHGWNAAAEIPAVAELAQYVGDLVPAHLNLVERRAIKDGKTSRFVVPVLDLQIGTARLKEIVAQKSGATAAVEAPTQRAQLESARAPEAQPRAIEAGVPDYAAAAAAATNVDDVKAIWHRAGQAGHLTDALKAALTEQVARFAPNGAPADPAPQQGVAGQVVDEDPDAIWQEILRVAGEQGMTTSQLNDHFAARNGGITPDTASAGELAHYLQQLRGGEAA